MMSAEVTTWQTSAERMALDPYGTMGDSDWRFRAGVRPAAADVVAVLADAVNGTGVVPWPQPQQALSVLRRLGSAPWRIASAERQGPRQHIRLSVGGATLALVVDTRMRPHLKTIGA